MHKKVKNNSKKIKYGAWYMKPNTWKRETQSDRIDPDLQKAPLGFSLFITQSTM